MKHFYKILLWVVLLLSLAFTACNRDVDVYEEIMHSDRTSIECLEDLEPQVSNEDIMDDSNLELIAVEEVIVPFAPNPCCF